MKGFTDKPTSTVGDDNFGIKKYIDGLTGFILDCNTPMTIAIQGDWGSGKTSMMNMIKAQLGDQVVTSWFNTWQYSQFNMGDALAISFLARLLSDLVTEQGKDSDKTQKVFRTLTFIARKVAVIAADAFIGGKFAETVEEGTKAFTEQQEVDLPTAIKELKAQFQDAVNNKINQAGKKVDRLVIFVDDLDRLHPGKAVELLEVLKLFLDCEKCVFVLAIDYAVVSQGVKQKYGELIGEEKGKSFFDKIIQVPFKMPVAQYDVKNYVASSLKALDISVSDSEVVSYVKLIQRSVGCNPRAMKRLFNAFLLLNKIAEKDKENKGAQKNTLFAILCLQLSFEELYNYIVQKAEDCKDDDFLKRLQYQATYTDESEGETLAHELHLNETDVASAAEFMKAFFDVIDQDRDDSLSEEERKSFISILRFSTITSNTATAGETMTAEEREYRTFNNGVAKDIIKAVQGDSKGPWKVFMARTYNNPEWKIHYAGGKREFEKKPFGKIIFEFKIATDVETKKAPLILHIYPDAKADFSAFDQCMQGLNAYGFTKGENGYWLNGEPVDALDDKAIINYLSKKIRDITEKIEKSLPA